MADFTTPTFLQNKSVDDIFEGMKQIIPDDIDISQGSHTWNFTRPTALVAAYLCQYVLPQTIQLIFPEWSYGEFLDAHAKTRGMTRRAATAASGDITITGTANAVIPAGSIFSTASMNNNDPSVDYATEEEATIPDSGTLTVTVKCTRTGTIGNTPENTVVLVSSTISGITAVTNPEAITGGTDTESDESLISRIEEYDKTQGDSFVGNIADYKRWATSVSGVGGANIIPANDDTGLVTIVLTDSNGDPATESLCTEVYNYIMSPDDPGQRMAPINAYLSVVPASSVNIGIRATIELTEGYTLDAVKTNFIANMKDYLLIAVTEHEVKYTRVAAVLSATAGVNDYEDLLIGESGSEEAVDYGTDNIAIATTELPIVEEEYLDFTEGTVG